MFNRKIRDIIQNTLQQETTSELLLDEIAMTEIDKNIYEELDAIEEIVKILK